MLKLTLRKPLDFPIYYLKSSADSGSIDALISKNLDSILDSSVQKLNQDFRLNLNFLVKTEGHFSQIESFSIYSFFERLSLKTQYIVYYALVGVGNSKKN